MKTLTKYLNEKLVINKNYKNIDDIEELFSNIDFKHDDKHTLVTSDDIFSIMVDYIRDHNIRSFSDFDSYRNHARENNNVCLVIFNKRIKDMNIFHKISNDNCKVFIIFKHYNIYMFKTEKQRLATMHSLTKGNTWNNVDEVEYYEISKETFDDISELYNKLIKK